MNMEDARQYMYDMFFDSLKMRGIEEAWARFCDVLHELPVRK